MSAKTTSNKKELQTMADLLAKSAKTPMAFTVGQKVFAKVIAKNPKSIIFDIGGKSEGVVAEKAFIEARDFIKTLKIGDEVFTNVLVTETREGNVILSLRQARLDAAWAKVEKAKKDDSEIAVYAKGANPSGIAVDVEGLDGFIPGSQLSREASGNTQNLVGKYFKAKVIEADRLSNKLVLSEKEVSEAEDIKAGKDALKKIKEGEIYEGTVTMVANFGCFVKLLIPKSEVSIEGLVHISEISWGRIEKVSDYFKEGDKVKVKVIGFNMNAGRQGTGKLALSIKQAKKDPWSEADKNYKKGSNIKGKVTRISDFGVFIELEPGVEGLVHMTKIPPTVRFTEGQEVNCTIEEIDSKVRKISLGLVLTSKPVGYK